MGQSFQGWDHMMGYGGFGGMFMWIIWLLIGGAIIYFIFSRINDSNKKDNPAPQNYLDILKNRYASGEIGKEEFDRLKKELES
jgi:putative membrane protein